MCQDHEGFLWTCTQTGMQRYDGTRFKNYFADIRDTAALQSDWVTAVFEDSKKRLWVGNDDGTAYTLNRATGKFYNYNLHTSAANRINGLWSFAEDKKGAIWIAGHEGIFKLNEASYEFEKMNEIIGLDKNESTGNLVFDGANNIWLNTYNGIKYYDQQKKKLYSKAFNPDHDPLFDLKNRGGYSLLCKDDYWFTGPKILYRYNVLTKKTNSITVEKAVPGKLVPEEQKETIGSIRCLDDGKIVIALPDRGIAIYDPAKDSIHIIEPDNTSPTSYHASKSGSYLCILQDKEKNILIGSDAGINMYNPNRQFFEVHKRNEQTKDLFPNEIASDFLELPGGNILISYYSINGGIVKTDSNFHFIKQYLYSEKDNKLNGSNQIWNLFRDENGIVWAPNQLNNILKLNLQSETVACEKDTALHTAIISIKKDNDGTIWMGLWNQGLAKRNAVTHQYTFYTDFLPAGSTGTKRVQCLLPEKDKIWTGTLQNGLQVFDRKTEKFTAAFVKDPKNKNAISSNCVTDILRYSKDTLVLATLMGVNVFDEKNKTFTAITTKEGLPNNLVEAIISDGLGNVWVACFNDGFCKINMHDLSITSYGINDGLSDNIFCSKFYRLKNGHILMGGAESFFSFNPASFTASAAPANVTITGIHVFENEVASDSLVLKKMPLQLSYKENSIRIEFASLNYWDPAGIKYFYRLKGIDKNWIVADRNQAAVYNQLTNGKYVLELKCTNRDGIECKAITELKIEILPPFWKTWWFILLTFLSVVAAFLVLIRWRENNIKFIEAEKLKVQALNAAHYKSKLELEQIINYFSSSLIDKNTIDDVLWDVAKNLIGRLGFVDCMIYLWNDDKTKMLQRAGHGPKGSIQDIMEQPFDVLPGQGIVGHVMQTKEPILINDTSTDSRYRADDFTRLSEITVPVIYNDELIGVLDSEHPHKNFYTQQHLHILSTIATLMANKIRSIEAEQSLQETQIAMYSMNEQLSKAKLEALRSQMNPHFIFNSLNAIQECILTNKVDAAYEYLSKFSKLQRMVLNNSQKELIPLSDEIEMIQLYLSLESLRFSDSFVYEIKLKGITDTSEIMIPSLITQPLVENAIWHGLRNKEGDKKLLIIYEEINRIFLITIEDNGIGRKKAAWIKEQKLGNRQFESKGSIIVQQRLNVLSQQLNVDIHLETIDKKNKEGNDAGTKVVISFPANLENT